MIYGLYKFLREEIRIFGNRLSQYTIIIGLLFIIYMFKGISLFNVITVLIILTILRTGMLNKPYLYLKNNLKIYLNKKIFKKRFITISSKTILFQKNPSDKSLYNYREVEGFILDKTVYFNESEIFMHSEEREKTKDYFKKYYEVIHRKGISDFIENDLKKEDDNGTIKKKLIINSLSNS